MSAFLMAVYFKGMTDRETIALTEAMMQSGDIIDLSGLAIIKVDKHSTGGVGDKVSIILAPVVAAAGVPVPMISGRGLGHTGGTLDKLESIPGFKTAFTIKQFNEHVVKHGVCLAGQSDNLVPADRKIYALRDVTSTVESIPLVVSSILSKKLAEGINALVLDIKTGTGAFMSEQSKAEELATKLIQISENAGVRCLAYITGMNQPLGKTVGNWLEIVECIDALKGKGPDDLMQVTLQLAGAMIYLGGQAITIEEGKIQAQEIIESGKAWNKFLEIVQVQGGNISYIKNPTRYNITEIEETIGAQESGYIKSINAKNVGVASVNLGAGRQSLTDQIDPAAGIILHKKRGDFVKKGEPIFSIYANSKEKIARGINSLKNTVIFQKSIPPSEPTIIKYLDRENISNG
jgi:pyrimidine-nucleoside phosphorylase